MVRTDLWKVLSETQAHISKYYATALTDESKHDELKNYIEKFILDSGYIVDGFDDDGLISRLYSEMVEYSTVTITNFSVGLSVRPQAHPTMRPVTPTQTRGIQRFLPCGNISITTFRCPV